MAWQPKVGTSEVMFRALDDEEEETMREFAANMMPPSDWWRTTCHPVAKKIWEEREANGEVIKPDRRR